MLKNDLTYTARFLNYVWPFFNIMHEKVNVYFRVTILTDSYLEIHFALFP